MIESINGKIKYRQSPANPLVIQIQRGYKRTWTDYAVRDTAKEARALVLALGMTDETQEVEAVQE